MDNLPLLRDVHLPVSEWLFPLGYGWFVLLGAIFVLYISYKIIKYIQSKSKKYYALSMLKKLKQDDLSSVIKISEILRRICLYKYKNAITLFGDEWIVFLNNHCSKKITEKAAEVLVYGPYIATDKKYDKNDYKKVKKFAVDWIGENL